MSFIGDVARLIWGLITSRPTNFSWLIEGQVAGSGRPSTLKELQWVKSRGIEAVLTLTEDDLPKEWFELTGITHLHIPVVNHTAPSLEDIHRAVEFVRTHVSKSVPTLIHCAAGEGRTGLMLACFLINGKHVSPREAVEKVRRLRPRSIENKVQEKAVYAYHDMLKSKGVI